MKTVLILGATGQIGQALLELALQHPEISRVVAPTRRPLPPHANLDNPLVDFEALPEDAAWWKADLTLCALGTTLRQAKSKAGFYRVDHDYILAAAKLASILEHRLLVWSLRWVRMRCLACFISKSKARPNKTWVLWVLFHW